MAHYEKFKSGAVGHILKHMDDYETRSKRENVDTELIQANWDLLPKDGKTAYQRYKEILAHDELKILKRPNINTLCSCIISLPQDFKGDEEHFFKECFNFLCQKHGKENCVSAVVHLDEPNAAHHLHFVFCPIIEDKKHIGKRKLCAKEIIDKGFLKRFHPELKQHLEQRLGVPCNVLNGATTGGNKTIEELKAESIKKEAEGIQATIEAQAKIVYEARCGIQNFLATEAGSTYLAAKDNKKLRKEVNMHRETINAIWQDYMQANNDYWNGYRSNKEAIITELQKSRIKEYTNRKELQKQLTLLLQRNEFFLTKLFRLCVILALYLKEPYLKEQVSELEEINKNIKDTARMVLQTSQNTAEALHTKNIDLIEKHIKQWEKALNVAEKNTQTAMDNYSALLDDKANDFER